MIKYIPQLDQATYITYEGITFPVPSRFDRVTIDIDGSVHGWIGLRYPQDRCNGYWTHGYKEFEDTKTLIGKFERDDGGEFEPTLWET